MGFTNVRKDPMVVRSCSWVLYGGRYGLAIRVWRL